MDSLSLAELGSMSRSMQLKLNSDCSKMQDHKEGEIQTALEDQKELASEAKDLSKTFLLKNNPVYLHDTLFLINEQIGETGADTSKMTFPDKIEFALRHRGNNSKLRVPDKLLCLTPNATIIHLKRYIRKQLLKNHAEGSALTNDKLKVFWMSEIHNDSKEHELDDEMPLKQLIISNFWRRENLQPGLDLNPDFWPCATQSNYYELAREKLYFKLV